MLGSRDLVLRTFLAFFLLIVLLFAGVAFASPRTPLRGVVTDGTGAPVSGALVTLQGQNSSWVQKTDERGRFQFVAPPEVATITAEASGFAVAQIAWTNSVSEVTLVLPVLDRREQVTVTATRTGIAAENAPGVKTLTRTDLIENGAFTLDDALRQVPGFTLFRRSGSATSNPTTLGVSLRGVGASGASRALVLNDGIPLNDPFGGWIYWGRVPLESVDRVEVVRGATSNLYGTDALGGVINVLPAVPTDTSLSVESSMGNLTTPLGSAIGSVRVRDWIGTLSGEAFRTNGYVNVPSELRGTVDTVTNSDHRTGTARLERVVSDKARMFLGGSIFTESRNNGKVGERNSANIRQLDLGTDFHSTSAGDFSVRVFGGTEGLRQNFFAIAPDRNSENLTRDQSVPVWQLGFSGLWSRQVHWNRIVAGVDNRWVDGESDETLFSNGSATSLVRSGGSQRATGVFAEDLIQLGSRLFVTLSARVDQWSNLDGHALTHALSATVTDKNLAFADRSETAFSPRAGAVYRLNHRISLNASVARSFRAPTLNELYRNFRVGSVLTLANENLRAEHLTGGELGAVTAFSDHLRLRTTYFWNNIDGPVANVTLNVTPALITRQRQNLGETRSRGVELEGEYLVRSNLGFTAGYQFADATVVSSPGNTLLQGLQIPQVPRHEFTFGTRYSNPKFLTAAVRGRFQARQFDDDLNQLPLESFFTLDAFISRQVGHNAELFVAAENLLNNQYEIGRTPVPTIAAPIMARAGIRLHFGGK